MKIVLFHFIDGINSAVLTLEDIVVIVILLYHFLTLTLTCDTNITL